MSKYLIVVIIVLLAVVGVMWNHVRSADERWETAMANAKAYDAQLAESGKKNVALQLTVDQLEYFNDSVLKPPLILKLISDI